MKKSILLTLIFITIFFIGGNRVSADDVTYSNYCEFNNDLEKEYGNSCRYEIKGSYDYIIVFYNETSSQVVWYLGDKNQKFYIKNGEKANYNYSKAVINHYFETYKNNLNGLKSCPSELSLYSYEYSQLLSNSNGITTGINYYNEYYLYENDSSVEKKDSFGIGTASVFIQGLNTITHEFVLSPCEVVQEKPEQPTEEPNCDLINDTLRGYINDVMNIIKIGVPILLIGLIIYDFSTAVFAGSDDQANKIKGKAIKRVIIAVVIFFVPTFINLFFDLVNGIWATQFEICGIEETKTE